MINEYLDRQDIRTLIDNISTNDKYYQKTNDFSYVFLGIDNKNKALFIMYEALLKYKLIVEDIVHLDSFVEQLDLLYRKLTGFNDIIIGINQIITRLCVKKLNLPDTDTVRNRKLLLDYIYNKYIVNGYYFHGFNSSYTDSIKVLGFEVEEYENFYQDFVMINNIFNKYNIINVCEKDFNKKEVSFTDNILYACSSSLRSPMYFYNIISNKDIDKKIDENAYVRDDYQACIKNLKRIFFMYDFSEIDKKFVLDVVDKEWNLLHRADKKISLLLIKRRILEDGDSIDINVLANDISLDINEAVDNIMYARNNRINYSSRLNTEDFEIVELDPIVEKKKEEILEIKEEEYREKEEKVAYEFQNSYGSVTALLLGGALLVSIGVIMTILYVLL